MKKFTLLSQFFGILHIYSRNLSLLFWLFPFLCFAQRPGKTSISNVDYKIKKNTIIVSYDLDNWAICDQFEKFKITLNASVYDSVQVINWTFDYSNEVYLNRSKHYDEKFEIADSDLSKINGTVIVYVTNAGDKNEGDCNCYGASPPQNFDYYHNIKAPYLVKQKELFEGKYFYSNDEKWLCSDVLLNPPTYSVSFIMKNEKGEQKTINKQDIQHFISEEEHIKEEEYKKQQKQDSIARQIENEKMKEEELKQYKIDSLWQDSTAKEDKKRQKLDSIADVKENLRITEEKERIEKENEIKEQAAKAKRKSDLIEKYGQANGELISEGKIAIGMTTEMCQEALGSCEYPFCEKTRVITSSDTTETWTYLNGDILDFDNGILVTMVLNN